MQTSHLPTLVRHQLESLVDVNRGFVVAVSGGADSVALARAVAATFGSGPIVLAHLNHRLRGDDSDADEAFVVDMHARLASADAPNRLHCACTRIDVGVEARALGVNLEAHARHVRYQWLAATARAHGVRWVLTGHTANDQAETVLHRLLRGTGLQGLRGIAFRRDLEPDVSVVRPLLRATRADVLGYLDELGQLFRHDQSNDNLDLTRNRIRKVLIPILQAQYNTAIVPILTRLAEQADEAFRDDEAATAQLLRESELPAAAGAVVLQCAVLQAAPRRLVREVFRILWRRENWPMGDMDYPAWDRLAALVFGEMNAVDLPGGVRGRRRERVVQVGRQV